MKKYSYNDCRFANEFLTDANKEIQKYRPCDFAEERCLVCKHMLSHEFLTNANYCEIGGFKVKVSHVCYKFEKM